MLNIFHFLFILFPLHFLILLYVFETMAEMFISYPINILSQYAFSIYILVDIVI